MTGNNSKTSAKCNSEISPVEFGEVKEKAHGAHDRANKIDIKLEQIDQKIDKIKWTVLVALLVSPLLNDLVPSGTQVLLAIFESFSSIIQITYANL